MRSALPLSARRICVKARKHETFDKLHRRNEEEKGREKLQDIDQARKHEILISCTRETKRKDVREKLRGIAQGNGTRDSRLIAPET